MKTLVVSIVVVGIGLALALGMTRGFDGTAIVIFGFIVAAGVLGIAVVNKWGAGGVRPATCEGCGGVISPNSPYCKHCGAPREVRLGS